MFVVVCVCVCVCVCDVCAYKIPTCVWMLRRGSERERERRRGLRWKSGGCVLSPGIQVVYICTRPATGDHLSSDNLFVITRNVITCLLSLITCCTATDFSPRVTRNRRTRHIACTRHIYYTYSI